VALREEKRAEMRIVTPVSMPETTTVVYLDLTWAGDIDINDTMASYVGLGAMRLVERDLDGHPVYRVEATLPVLITWLTHEYDTTTASVLDQLARTKLAQ
jgi:hypothetical protein